MNHISFSPIFVPTSVREEESRSMVRHAFQVATERSSNG